MWRPAVVGQIREMQAIALSIEPPVPCCLRNPDLGYRPGHSSATGLAGTEDSSKTALEAWMLRGAVRYGLLETPARLTRNGEDRLGRLGARGVWFPSTSSGQALRRAQDGLITNGGGPELVLGRLGCCRLCGSTRAAEDGAPAHHERVVGWGCLGKVGW